MNADGPGFIHDLERVVYLTTDTLGVIALEWMDGCFVCMPTPLKLLQGTPILELPEEIAVWNALGPMPLPEDCLRCITLSRVRGYFGLVFIPIRTAF